MIKFSNLFLVVAIFLASCSTTNNPTPTGFSLTDGLGRQITIDKKPNRIISLAPSNTEILFALGEGSSIVGRDEFSDYPVEAKKIPSVGGVEKFNMEQIINLKPDLALATGITPPEQIAAIEALKIKVFYIENPKNLDGMFNNVLLVGKLMANQKNAEALVVSMKTRVSTIEQVVASTSTRPSVFYELDGSDPSKPWTAGKGSFIDLLIQSAGGSNVGNIIQGEWGQISLEQLVIEDPDVIIMGDMIYGISPEQVILRPGWDKFTAVRNNKLYPFDDNLASRPGPRMVDGLLEFAKILHPEISGQLK